jgi:aspartyl-tRNA(Asn)/glutamyl-tRNA(Gln) amidotransferase subunit A
MARRVEDLQTLFDVLNISEPSSSAASSARANLKGLHVAWYTEDGVAPVTEETRRAVETAARALAEGGLATEERRPPHVERGHDLWLKLFSRASVVQLRHAYDGREDEAGAFVSWRLATADNSTIPTVDEFISSWMERDRLRVELLGWMEKTPILVTPVGAIPAFKHDAHKVTVAGSTINIFRAFSHAQAFNVFDLPAATVSAGRSSDGLPIGVQIVGRPHDEKTVLLATSIVEEALGGWRMPALMSDML